MGDTCIELRKIEVDFKDVGRLPEAAPHQLRFLPSRNKRLRDIFTRKLRGSSMQFVVTVQDYSRAAAKTTFAVVSDFFEDEQLFHEGRSYVFELEKSAIQDKLKNSFTLRCKDRSDGKRYTVKLVSAASFQDVGFKEALHEIHLMGKLVGCRYVAQLKDHFVLYCQQADVKPLTLVMLFDYAQFSLSQLMDYKKEQREGWLQNQYNSLFTSSYIAMNEAHLALVAHRDIRPHNICYCPDKKAFLLFHFAAGKALANRDNDDVTSLPGVPLYSPQALALESKNQEVAQVVCCNLFNRDLFSYAVSLLQAMYLEGRKRLENLPLATITNQQRSLLLTILRYHSSPDKLVSYMKPLEDAAPIDLGYVSQNVRGDARKRVDYLTMKEVVGAGYLSLFQFDNWLKQMDDIRKYFKSENKQDELIDFVVKLSGRCRAVGYPDKAAQYSLAAASLLNAKARVFLNSKSNREAQEQLERGVACLKSCGMEDSAESGQLLSTYADLSQQTGDLEAAKLYQTEAANTMRRAKGEDSAQHIRALVKVAKLLLAEGASKPSEKQLKEALKLAEKGTTPEQESAKADVLTELGETQRVRAFQSREKQDKYRQKAEECLLDALQIKERLFGTASAEISQALARLGHIYFDLKEFHKAKRSYQRALALKQHHYGQYSQESGELLTCLGNCSKGLREFESSRGYYTEAIAVFRKTYNTDNHLDVALAVGNLGLVSRDEGNTARAKELLGLALNILRRVLPDVENQADFIFFQSHLMKIA